MEEGRREQKRRYEGRKEGKERATSQRGSIKKGEGRKTREETKHRTLVPERRVLVAISLGNLGQLRLPATVSEVTLIADMDDNATATAQLGHAIEAHRAAGRRVRIWQNQYGGKDLNDALRAALRDEETDNE